MVAQTKGPRPAVWRRAPACRGARDRRRRGVHRQQPDQQIAFDARLVQSVDKVGIEALDLAAIAAIENAQGCSRRECRSSQSEREDRYRRPHTLRMERSSERKRVRWTFTMLSIHPFT